MTSSWSSRPCRIWGPNSWSAAAPHQWTWAGRSLVFTSRSLTINVLVLNEGQCSTHETLILCVCVCTCMRMHMWTCTLTCTCMPLCLYLYHTVPYFYRYHWLNLEFKLLDRLDSLSPHNPPALELQVCTAKPISFQRFIWFLFVCMYICMYAWMDGWIE